MGQNGTNDLTNKYTRKKELCYLELTLKVPFDKANFLSILILIDQFYDYYQMSDNHESIDWHQAIKSKFVVSETNMNSTCITPKLYISNELNHGFIEDAFKISYSLNYIIFNIYADLYTDIRYGLDENNKYYKIDQSKSANRNRVTLTNFLKELEVVLNGEITGFYTDNHLTQESVFKYGITANASLIEDDYKDEL